VNADYDVAILGAGLAGLSLAVRLAEPRFAGLRVLIAEPRTEYRRDRTWSYWALHPHPFQAAVASSWDRWAVVANGRAVMCRAPGLRYESIPADAFYRSALDLVRAAPHIDMRSGVAASAAEDADGVTIRFGREETRASVAFDTRPPTGPRHGLTQVFGGLEIETTDAVFDPDIATLMDFRGVSAGAAHFTYVLPSTSRRALVEDTWFAPAGFRPPDHRAAVREHMLARHGVVDFAVLFEERGALPMDPVFRPHPGTRLLPFGTAGGATRPSTGYAFNAVQAQCDEAAAALAAGRPPMPARARPAMVRMMDRTLLSLLERRPELAPHIFASLFDRCEPGALVRFLNDRARPADLAAVAAAIPFIPAVAAAARLALGSTRWSRPAVAG
jgi:lycopene beta-cyclase